MSDLQPGAGPPEERGGDRDGLPDLPAEWGTIIVPDDASGLATEARAVRRELRRQARSQRPRQIDLEPARPAPGEQPAGVGVPFLIIIVAAAVTAMSLFVITWDPRAVAPVPASTSPSTAGWPRPPTSPPEPSGTAQSNLTPTAPDGLRGQPATVAPAAILFDNGCARSGRCHYPTAAPQG